MGSGCAPKSWTRRSWHGTDFACDALQEVDDLDPRDRQSILRRVQEELEAELTGAESARAVEARVDDILDEELGEAEDGDDAAAAEDDEDDDDWGAEDDDED